MIPKGHIKIFKKVDRIATYLIKLRPVVVTLLCDNVLA